MTPTQAAELIGCTARHVRTLIARGQIHASPNRYSYSIPIEEVRRFLRKPQSGRGFPRGAKRNGSRGKMAE